MELFRITYHEFSQQLFAPGLSGRWNLEGEEVIYFASPRSLACLENIVHKNNSRTMKSFRTMVVYVPDQVSIQQINLSELPVGWNQVEYSGECQKLGSFWLQKKEFLLLRVPSAVIPEEYNYVVNTHHPDFKLVKLIDVLPFFFDMRLSGHS